MLSSVLFYLICSLLFLLLVLVPTLLLLLSLVLFRKCKSKVCLVGKTAIVTGGASGLGFAIASDLACRGCRVIIADCCNADAAKEQLIKLTHNSNIVAKYVDLGSFKSIRSFAKDIVATEGRLDILINNAGVTAASNKRSEDNLQYGMQVNHFGAFLLTHLLIDLLKKSAPSRIVWISSTTSYTSNLKIGKLNSVGGQTTVFSDYYLYANSKLCVTITSNIFARKLKGTGVTSNACCPGLVRTAIFRKFTRESTGRLLLITLGYCLITLPFGKTPDEGAQTPLFLAVSDEMKGKTGGYYFECQQWKAPSKARDDEFAEKVWKISEEVTGISSTDYFS